MKFAFEKIYQTLMQLESKVCIKSVELNGFSYVECQYKVGNELPQVDSSWSIFKHGGRWGGRKETHYWFYKKVKTDGDCLLTIKTGKEGQWDATNPQFMVYIDGVLTQGLDTNHTQVQLVGKKEYNIYLYAYCGMLDNFLEFMPSINYIDKECEKLYYDIKVPLEICNYLQPDEKTYIDIIKHLEKAVLLLDLREPFSSEYNISIQHSLNYMEKKFYEKFCGNSEVTAICIGHTHIDVAWLWTLSQTREKVLRSFSTVVNLMKQYPEYKFMSSQAQLYKYLKEDCPQLYEEVKELIKQERWEVEGAMWVEADCNLPSGESFIRQILFGKRFFKKEFNVDSKILWLPDVFGYSAALPQILRKSGVDKFLTSKISWNETNQMPNDTFYWQGIDGTEILTYFLTGQDKFRDKKPVTHTTYVSTITPSHIAGTWDRYQNKNLSNEVIVTFGYGDGGGGPNKEMLEVGRRLAKGIKGCPKVKIETATSFLTTLENRVKKSGKVPKWVGELYLELHRGTYTSIAKTKRNNRKCEYLYQNTELICTMDSYLNNANYPKQLINNGWEIILLNQFHDIIPGSSIKEVYDESDIQYAKIKSEAEKMNDDSYRSIAKNINTNGGLLVFNPHYFVNSGIVSVDGKMVYVSDIPPKGYKVVGYKCDNHIKVSDNLLENKFFKVKFRKGNIVTIYDKLNNREILKKGQNANVMQAFEDFPRDWDAWEISNYYIDKMWVVDDVQSIIPIDDGVRAGFLITRKFLNSIISQKIYLYDDIPRIDFDTCIDWQEEHILLKVLFPVDIHAEKATYDVQFGNVERPVHHNTSWDAAKFEVCAHKFADISEDDYGVSLMNDCKYGYDIFGNDMRLTLLKSPTYPNPDADKGMHNFVYSLYPHKGNFKQSKAVQMAYDINIPMVAIKVPMQVGKLKDEFSLIGTDCENIIIETVKHAEDDDSIIIRLFDCYNRRSTPTVSFGFDVNKVYITDMMENIIEEVAITKNTVCIPVKPFEIVTLKVESVLWEG